MSDCCDATSNPVRCAVIHLYKSYKYTFKLISIALIYDRRAHRKRIRHQEKKESADKPGSVVDSHSSRPCVAARLKQPTRERRGPRHAPLCGLAPGGVCHATRRCPRARCALTAPFHHHHACLAAPFGCLFSVALSVGSRRPGVTWHLALRSPDFPRPRLVAEKRPRLPGRLQAHSIAITSSTYR